MVEWYGGFLNLDERKEEGLNKQNLSEHFAYLS